MVSSILPLELWLKTISFLDHPDLSICCRVRRDFVRECQRRLFATVAVVIYNSSSTRLLEILHESPHIIPHISHFHLSLPPFSTPKTKWFSPDIQFTCADILSLLIPSLHQITLTPAIPWGALSHQLRDTLLIAFNGPSMDSVHLELQVGAQTHRIMRDAPRAIENCPHLKRLSLITQTRIFPFIQFENCLKLDQLELMLGYTEVAPEYTSRTLTKEEKIPLRHLCFGDEDKPQPAIVFMDMYWPFSWTHIRVLELSVTESLEQLQTMLWLCAETIEVLSIHEVYDEEQHDYGILYAPTPTIFPRLHTLHLRSGFRRPRFEFLRGLRSLWGVASITPAFRTIETVLGVRIYNQDEGELDSDNDFDDDEQPTFTPDMVHVISTLYDIAESMEHLRKLDITVAAMSSKGTKIAKVGEYTQQLRIHFDKLEAKSDQNRSFNFSLRHTDCPSWDVPKRAWDEVLQINR
ncbi:hypothetical protein DL96DRAFT_1709985 [Flagelloscypha sp. PMI_526]|nr:hypothetical protein DL96DRAFT_1709985 [Flagelloscypha sp. PMI_526]